VGVAGEARGAAVELREAPTRDGAGGEVAPALEAICLKAMAREPADRYPSAKALAGDIERWLADEPVAVYRDPWMKRAARFAKRHRTAMTAAGVLVATSLVGLGVGNVLIRQRARHRPGQ